MEFLIIFVVLVAVVVVVSAPLRRPRADVAADVQRSQTTHDADVADLEAARDAKYREIRDADLDHRTGKLSDEDYAQLDAGLRAEAVEIMNALDRLEPRQPA
jgi:hypothetical protein